MNDFTRPGLLWTTRGEASTSVLVRWLARCAALWLVLGVLAGCGTGSPERADVEADAVTVDAPVSDTIDAQTSDGESDGRADGEEGDGDEVDARDGDDDSGEGDVEPSDSGGTSCASPADCAGGETCLRGTCRTLCLGDDDCDTGSSCHPDTRVCVECLDDSVCAAPLRCDPIGGLCVEGCAVDADCGGGELCVVDRCVEIECTSDTECGDGVCSRGLCVDARFDVCQPRARRCEGESTVAICSANGSGYTSYLCGEGSDCEGGGCVPARCDDDGDCSVDDACSASRCADGLCVVEAVPDGEDLEDGDCRRTGCVGGELVDEPDDSDIPPNVSGDCRRPACSSGSVRYLPEPRDLPANTPGDCVELRCDGAELVSDPAPDDLPIDVPGDCVEPVCRDGEVAFAAADDPPEDEPGDCMDVICEAGAASRVPADDPPPDEEGDCRTVVCEDGEASLVPADDPPAEGDTEPGDCRVPACRGGALRSVPGDDPPADEPGDCLTPICEDGAVRAVPADDLRGVVDEVDGDCRVPVCRDGGLALGPGDDPPAQTPGDCVEAVCEGGEVVDLPSEADVPVATGLECFVATCTEDGPSLDPSDELCVTRFPCRDAHCDGVTLECELGEPDEACLSTERCDGLDNDGDGVVDESPVDEEIGEACYLGIEGTADVGMCRAGVLACRDGAVRCVGQITPAESEWCDGLDSDCDGDQPTEELSNPCGSDLDDDGSVQRVDLTLAPAFRRIDLLFLVSGARAAGDYFDVLESDLGRTTLRERLAAIVPSVSVGVGHIGDFPLPALGGEGNTPLTLAQRVVGDFDAAAAELGSLDPAATSDGRIALNESLFLAASGGVTTWLAPAAGTPAEGSATTGTLAVITREAGALEDTDWYAFEALAGSTVTVAVEARSIGSTLDPKVGLWDASGTRIAEDDDGGEGFDSLLTVTIPATGTYFLDVEPFSRSATSSTTVGYYRLRVEAGGTTYVAPEGDCTIVEVGDDEPFDDPSLAVALSPLAEAVPYDDVEGCRAICDANLPESREEGDVRRDEAIDDFCEQEPPPPTRCGDGVIGEGESCDDGGTTPGDGCSASCQRETRSVGPYPEPGTHVADAGMGALGGAGFRRDALPILAIVSDDRPRSLRDYAGHGVDVHSEEETIAAVRAIGGRAIGVGRRAGGIFSGDNALASLVSDFDSDVPRCAFDALRSEPGVSCRADECCTGIGGDGERTFDTRCGLARRVPEELSSIEEEVVDLIGTLVDYGAFDVHVEARDDPRTPGVDERCFVDTLELVEVGAEPDGCSTSPSLAEPLDGMRSNRITNLRMGTPIDLAFELSAADRADVDGDGDRAERCSPPGRYRVTVDVVTDGGQTVSSHTVRYRVVEP